MLLRRERDRDSGSVRTPLSVFGGDKSIPRRIDSILPRSGTIETEPHRLIGRNGEQTCGLQLALHIARRLSKLYGIAHFREERNGDARNNGNKCHRQEQLDERKSECRTRTKSHVDPILSNGPARYKMAGDYES